MKSDWRKRKRRTRLAKANGFNHYHEYKEYVKYSVKLDGLMKRCMCVAQMSDFVNKYMEYLVKETWCTETYCDDDPFDCLFEGE